MKHYLTVTIIFNALLVWPSCLAVEVTSHKADVCVYGGTASGVMAALAADVGHDAGQDGAGSWTICH